MKKSVLVVAAHPDDEVLGCGGTIAKFSSQGVTVNLLFISDGVSSRLEANAKFSEQLVERKNSAERAGKILGVSSMTFLDYPDNRLDSIPLLEIVKRIELSVKKFCPETVMTHHPSDLNIDHQLVSKAVVTACRPAPGCSVKALLFFETPSSTEWQVPTEQNVFKPIWFEDISKYLVLKLRALECYSEELRQPPHPRSLQAVERMAHFRGANVGIDAAEAYMLGRFLSD